MRQLLPAAAVKEWAKKPGGGYSGPWVVGKRTLAAYHHQPDTGWEVPAAIIESVEAINGRPAYQRVVAPFPSPKTSHAQVVWDRLLLLSLIEKRAWYLDVDSGKFTPHDVPLSPELVNISSISHTRDFVLIAEELPATASMSRSRLLVLTKDLQLVDRIDLPGYTDGMSTTARPWRARQDMDGIRLVRRP